MSRDTSSYKVDTWTSLAAKQYERAGIGLHPGEQVTFLLKNVKDPLKEERVRAAPCIRPEDCYDVEKYVELLDRAAEELWISLGAEGFGCADLIQPPRRPARGTAASEKTILW
jgi:hypothetical protein